MTKGYYHKQMWYLFLKLLACMAFLILLIEFLTSCEHKDLCYDHPHRQNVEVTFDWSEAPDANPSTMSLYLYPENGGAPQRYEFTDRNGGCISVAAGTYDAICVNSDKEIHRINGKETRKSFEVTSAETRVLQGLLASMAQSAPRATDGSKERVMSEPEMLWSAHAERLVIKTNGEKSFITLKPKARVKHCSVEIKNVQNLRGVKAMSASISGLSGGWFAGIDELSPEKVTIPFPVTVDVANSKVTGSVNVFGHCPIQPNKHILMVYAQLNDGSNWYYEDDVTDQIHDPEQKDDETHIKIELDKLPLPKPNPGTEGGLQPSVSKWNEIYIDIKM